jgi:hypothetical protein
MLISFSLTLQMYIKKLHKQATLRYKSSDEGQKESAAGMMVMLAADGINVKYP